ncbi:M48 family metalloprotease [Herbaspirillum sp. SJZ107]|uniref:M48 family metalloprotease n=1 Tax=Herbaspirillum sp. SJZ107 TaxID=2572881 RepID=UPI001152C2D5|nr:M48 family metalloprotease [Herbaspirillum sp. SJZ107]TQK11055.1 peptidase M48-like protein [Herbaspirillum sp. SJZ107]
MHTFHRAERRKFMRRLGLFLWAAQSFAPTPAQARTFRLSGPACAMNDDVQARTITAFASSSEAKNVVADICNCVALPANFEIAVTAESHVNAYATVIEHQRYIFYNQAFMESVADRHGKNWSGLTVMAHEVGHHLCGHTLDNIGSRPPRELEADNFAGFVVGSLGGRLPDATAAFRSASEAGSARHPPRHERIAAITAGWQRAARVRQSNKEQFNLITHNGRPNGTYARVVSEFVNEGAAWVEYQHGRSAFTFTEGARDPEAVYLYDRSREVWLRITTNNGAGVSVGSWNRGKADQLPDTWMPLDPVDWR